MLILLLKSCTAHVAGSVTCKPHLWHRLHVICKQAAGCVQIVMYLRLVTSVYIHEHREFFAPFILVRALLCCLSGSLCYLLHPFQAAELLSGIPLC